MEATEKRNEWMVRLIALTLLIQGAISYPAWLPGSRSFPHVGIFDAFSLGGAVQKGLVFIAVGCLLGMLIKPRRIVLLVGGLAAICFLVADDLNRLQPWLFLFGWILATWGILLRTGKTVHLASFIRCLLGIIYAGSGLQKLNPVFSGEMFPWLSSGLGLDAASIDPAWGYIAAAIELGAGLCLLHPRTWKWGAISATGICLFILASLGPFGHNWNAVVWPWNLAFLALIWMSRPATIKVENPFPKWGVVSLCVLGALPVAHVAGAGDHFLAAGYYTGLAPMANFYYDETDRPQMPAESLPWQRFREGETEEFIPLAYWALGEMSIPSYPEVRVIKALGRQLCDCLQSPDKGGVTIEFRRRFSREPFSEKWSCNELDPLKFPRKSSPSTPKTIANQHSY